MHISDAFIVNKKAIQPKDALRSTAFRLVAGVPFAVFLLIELLYTFGFLLVPAVCILATIFGLAGGILLICTQWRGALFAPLGISILAAVSVGTLLGLFFYDTYAIFPMFYANAAVYSNVVPHEPSAAVADAGKILFTLETSVDANHSVGYITEQGNTYCAAPVKDNSPLSSVEFWAVGIGCCDELGGFTCDAWNDVNAHAGIVVFDNNGYFTNSRHDYYNLARLKAEAQWGLLSSPAPMFVRWVTQADLGMLENHYRLQLGIALTAASVLYLGVSCGLALLLHKPGSTRLG